jgi:hypothetical protein
MFSIGLPIIDRYINLYENYNKSCKILPICLIFQHFNID